MSKAQPSFEARAFRRVLISLLLICAFAVSSFAQLASREARGGIGFPARGWRRWTVSSQRRLANVNLPGAVVLVARNGKVVWRKAYGNRAVEPVA